MCLSKSQIESTLLIPRTILRLYLDLLQHLTKLILVPLFFTSGHHTHLNSFLYHYHSSISFFFDPSSSPHSLNIGTPQDQVLFFLSSAYTLSLVNLIVSWLEIPSVCQWLPDVYLPLISSELSSKLDSYIQLPTYNFTWIANRHSKSITSKTEYLLYWHQLYLQFSPS